MWDELLHEAPIERETREDKVLQKLFKLVLNGWPRYQAQAPEEARNFFVFRGELSYVDEKFFIGIG